VGREKDSLPLFKLFDQELILFSIHPPPNQGISEIPTPRLKIEFHVHPLHTNNIRKQGLQA
jgi:hypothetical protein